MKLKNTSIFQSMISAGVLAYKQAIASHGYLLQNNPLIKATLVYGDSSDCLYENPFLTSPLLKLLFNLALKLLV